MTIYFPDGEGGKKPILQGGGTDYELQPASKTSLGGVKVGKGLSIDSGGKLDVTISGGSDYFLPTASSSVKGGVKVGKGLSIDSGGKLDVTIEGGDSDFVAKNINAQSLYADLSHATIKTSNSRMARTSAKESATTFDGHSNFTSCVSVGSFINDTANIVLDVNGGVYVAGKTSLDNFVTITKNLDVNGDLNSHSSAYIDGNEVVSGSVTINGSLRTQSLSAHRINMDIPNSSINAYGSSISGDVAFFGNESVTGNVTISGNTHLNNVTVNGNLDIPLPTASDKNLGAIKIGEGLSIDSLGKLDVTIKPGTTYTLLPATEGKIGGVKIEESRFSGLNLYEDGSVRLVKDMPFKVTLSGGVVVSDISALDATVTLTGAKIAIGNSTLTGQSPIYIDDGVSVSGTSTLKGNLILQPTAGKSKASIEGDVNFVDNVGINGEASLETAIIRANLDFRNIGNSSLTGAVVINTKGDATVDGNASISGNITVGSGTTAGSSSARKKSGSVTITNNVSVGANADINGNLEVKGALNVSELILSTIASTLEGAMWYEL